MGLIASALTQAGIDVHAVDLEPLHGRPVVQDLIALTRALVHPGDRTAWLSVLRAPWCGLLLPDLHALVAADAASTIMQRMNAVLESDENVLSDEGKERLERVGTVLRAAIAQRGRHSLRDWVERTWNALGGPATLSTAQDLDDAAAFFDRLDAIEVAGDLQDIARLEEQLQQLYARARLRGNARVEVMTIHKAKGLEFDVVVLPALHRWMRGEERELLRWTRIADIPHGIVFAPVKAQSDDVDPVYRWIELLEKQRSRRERGRLLYVAATRAKRSLHLLGSVEVKRTAEKEEVREPREGSMLGMLWHEVSAHFEAALTGTRDASSEGPALAGPALLRRLPSTWRLPEVVDAPVADSPAGSAQLAEPPFDWVSETGRHVGTLVHRELDRLSRAVLNAQSATVRPDRDRVRAELIELGVLPDRLATATERVIAALNATLADERGRWVLGIDAGHTEGASELALTGVIGGKVVSGVVDRTFVAPDGTRWVVDFKTSTHEGGGLDSFLDEEVERYRPQLARYTRLVQLFSPGNPVRAALYFPLLRAWREVSV